MARELKYLGLSGEALFFHYVAGQALIRSARQQLSDLSEITSRENSRAFEIGSSFERGIIPKRDFEKQRKETHALHQEYRKKSELVSQIAQRLEQIRPENYLNTEL
jgi:hypothetical protein